MSIVLEANKTYLTDDGYIVPIVKVQTGLYYSTLECSPGDPKYGNRRGNGADGWAWNKDGTISGLSEEWTKKLTIVKELPFPLPKPPEGYRYKGGFPRLKKVEKGDTYLTSHSSDVNGVPSSRYGKCGGGPSEENHSGFNSLRLMLERIPVSKETAVGTQSPPSLPVGYEWTQNPPEFRTPKTGDQYIDGKNAIYATCSNDMYDRKEWIVRKITRPSIPPMPYGFEWTQNPPEFRVPRNGNCYIYRGEAVVANGSDNAYSKPEWIVRPISKKEPENNIAREIPVKSEEVYPQYYFPEGISSTIAFVQRNNKTEYNFVFCDGTISGKCYEWTSAHDDYYKKALTEERAMARVTTKVKTNTPPESVTKVEEALPVKLPGVTMSTNYSMKPLNIVLPDAPKQSHLSYWITEPLGNMLRAAKKSVRYFVVSSLIGAVGYTAYNPSGVAKFAKSCIPKVHIKVDR